MVSELGTRVVSRSRPGRRRSTIRPMRAMLPTMVQHCHRAFELNPHGRRMEILPVAPRRTFFAGTSRPARASAN